MPADPTLSLSIDPNHPYLKKQLIAYIGNKRALQGFLQQVITRLVDPGRGVKVFLDPFSGSGAVSRLARLLGFRILANDWEFYAYVLNTAHLGSHLESRMFFQASGGVERIFDHLNHLPPPGPSERYISKHYAPVDTDQADYRYERLFYTQENARIIDAGRNEIEALYPGFDLGERERKEKYFLLASLLYQCATHTNTSGVFKACHKGFGGHGKDALNRIMAPIWLEPPLCIDSPVDAGPETADGPQGAVVFRQDAALFCSHNSGDICYLDPPYNQHQYGSNYHLLNSIALWDKPEVDDTRVSGRLKNKAAIRPDWKATRSAFCYRNRALPAFRDLVERVDARYLLVSYNTEGIIPFEALSAVLNTQGRLEIFTNDYIKYRGGKQSINRLMHNVELLLVVDRRKQHRPLDSRRIDQLICLKKTRLLMGRSFVPQKIKRTFPISGPAIRLREGVILTMSDFFRFEGSAVDVVGELELGRLHDLAEKLQSCVCADRREEIDVLVDLVRGSSRIEPAAAADRRIDTARIYTKRILLLLRKFAHKKYRRQFFETHAALLELTRDEPALFQSLEQGLQKIEALARIRFQG